MECLLTKTEAPFAAHIKRHVPSLLVSTVGCIPLDAQPFHNKSIDIFETDVLFFGQTNLRDLDFPLLAAEEPDCAAPPLLQFRSLVWKLRSPDRN